MSRTCVRIGNSSGYYGDRLSAMREMLEGGDLDYLTGDYLAELTMLILGRDQMKDPALGYAKTFIRQMTDCMGLAKDKGVRIVTNAGGLNPAACAARLRDLAAAQGLDINIAHIEGDDLRQRAEEFAFNDALGGQTLTANAYLGAFGIAEALGAGADVVVTGRVTDASVVVGPAIAHFGWGREDFDALAGAVVAGHVIECGTQATGGNFSGFGSLQLRQAGFPIAEVAADGSAVITKHADTGGAVTVDTVTAQLVYEVSGPTYLNPDVTTYLDTMSVTQSGDDRVAISGVTGSAPPDTTKVCLNTLGGFRNSVEFILTGLDIDAKAALINAQMEEALVALDIGPDSIEWQLDRTDVEDPETQAAATTLLRCHVKSTNPDAVGRAFSSAAVELALASYPGFTMTRQPAAGTPFGVYRPAYVPQSEVPHVVVLEDGSRLAVNTPTVTVTASGANSRSLGSENRKSAPLGEKTPLREVADTVRKPLGNIAYARSGDKGGDANVGVWIPADHPHREAAYAWLEGLLTAETVKQLLPEAAPLDIEIHPFSNLFAVNIVIHGLLGDGVAASTRFDPQAKALGEWIRARHVAIPVGLCPRDLTKEEI